MSPSTTLNVQTLDMLLKHLETLRNKDMSWRDIVKKHYPGVPPGTLCSIYKGRVIKKPEIRKRLGLPQLVTQEWYRDEKGRRVKAPK